MKTLLITGADHVAGANLAAVLSDHFRVVTLSASPTAITGCESHVCSADDSGSVQTVFHSVRPDVVIHCGHAAETSWTQPGTDSDSPTLQALCSLAPEHDCRVVFISSDQVYRGPWMFHTEDSDCLERSTASQSITACEDLVRETPGGLVLRTNIIGWSPAGDGFLEDTIARLESGQPFDFGHFATPIAAGRFAEIVRASLDIGLSGVFNIGGAERVTPFTFAEAVAKQFDLPQPTPVAESVAVETSLRCRAIRQAVSIPLPTLRETVELIFEEREADESEFGLIARLASAA